MSSVLNDKIERWQEWIIYEKRLSLNTQKSYQRDLTKFSKFLEASGINELEGITEEMSSAWVADLFQNNVSARSIQRHISSAKGFFGYMKKIYFLFCHSFIYSYSCTNLFAFYSSKVLFI